MLYEVITIINGVRKQEDVQPVLDGLKAFGVKVIYAQGDVSKKEDRENILQTVVAEFGQLNVLVNNAGIAPKDVITSYSIHYTKLYDG